MRLLFELDRKDYAECTSYYRRDSARSIIIRDGKVAMIHSQTYDYYKFPGGGIEQGETPIEAMIRETQEEAGLIAIPDSIQEYGLVHRMEKSEADPFRCFIQDNYYYICDAEERVTAQHLTANEAKEAFVLEFVEPEKVIKINGRLKDTRFRTMSDREARVLEMLIEEGYFE